MKSFSGAPTSVTSVGSTQLTTINCFDCPYAYPGANVTIAGASGSWVGLNGNYTNAVSHWEHCMRPRWDLSYGVDFIKSGASYTGSMIVASNRFLLIKDTYDPVNYQADSFGFASDIGTNATVSINIRFYSNMPYNEFFANVAAMMMYIVGPTTHSYIYPNYIPTSTFRLGQLPTQWNKLGAVTGNTLAGSNLIRYRNLPYLVQPVNLYVRRYYNNGASAQSAPFTSTGGQAWLGWYNRNDPYEAESYLYKWGYTGGVGGVVGLAANNTFDAEGHNLTMNYLQTGTVRNCYIGCTGTGTNGPIETDPVYSAQTSYAFLKNSDYPDTFKGSQFAFKLYDYNSTPVGSGPNDANNPDPNYWMMGGGTAPTSVTTNISNILKGKSVTYFGQVKLSLTNNPGSWTGPVGQQSIGYYKITRNAFTIDAAAIMGASAGSSSYLYAPKPALPNISLMSQASAKYFSVIMTYLVSTLGSQSIIIDIRGNSGGGVSLMSFAAMFGGNRGFIKQYQSKKGTGFNNILDIVGGYTLPNNNGSQYLAVNANALVVDNSIAAFGTGCVFRGTSATSTGTSKVVLLDSSSSISAASQTPWWFKGDNHDGNIGSNTRVKFLGSADMRYDGTVNTSIALDPPVPISSVSNKINTWPYINCMNELNAGTIVAKATGTALWFHEETPLNGMDSALNGFKGSSGRNAFPEDAKSTILQDWGLITNTRTDNSKWFWPKVAQPDPNDRTTWRDSWLESAIYDAVNSYTF